MVSGIVGITIGSNTSSGIATVLLDSFSGVVGLGSSISSFYSVSGFTSSGGFGGSITTGGVTITGGMMTGSGTKLSQAVI